MPSPQKKKRAPVPEKRLEAINRRVYRDFPEVQGVRPTVRRLHHEKGKAESRVLLTYRRRVVTADGRRMTRLVRVLVTSKGKILKITTSR